MRNPTFNWAAEDKYNEIKNLRLEVNNILKLYSMPQADQIAIIKNWLGGKGLQFLESLTQMKEERCNAMEGLFTTLNIKFKPQYNETLKSLQFHKLGRQTNENTKEWKGRLKICSYRVYL